ncbi:MAG: DUF3098 domain-containing protein [Bacteroidaceae bacterium]|nr:DUF3098 domain-containing protein [Bacteroidaceae bacterium]MBQ6800521.1 DUF3098 domain-containing protein [Bacteroidaceae bacterium]
MDKQTLAFGKKNYILLGIGMAIIILGFILMSGPGSTETHFEPDIFSARRIKVAPAVCFFGFIFMIYGILCKPKSDNQKTTSTDIK